MENHTELPRDQLKEYTRELRRLYKENEQLALRNGIQSPFSSG
jgi:hypothetical protein